MMNERIPCRPARRTAKTLLAPSLVVLGVLSIISLSMRAFSHEGEQHGAPAATTIGLGPVQLSDEAKRDLDFQVEDAGLRTISAHVSCFGAVRPVPGRVFWTSIRVPGRVKSVAVNVGDAVRAGDLLGEVEARQVAESPAIVKLLAEISGIVTEANVFVGQPVEPQSTLFRTMDLSTIHLECHVYEADIGRVHVGQKVRFYPEVLRGEHIDGEIVLVGGMLAETGRTLPVWARMKNPEGLLRPGMQGRVEVVVEEAKDVVAVPVSALLGEAGNYFVFVETGEYYVGQLVGLGLRDSAFVELTRGILPGDRVVVRGGYQLQFAATAMAGAKTRSAEGKGEAEKASSAPGKDTSKEAAESAPVADAASPAASGVVLGELARANLRIVTEEVETRTIDQVVTSFGVVDAQPARKHEISTLVAGRAVRVLANEGQHVRAGELLAEVESREVAEPPPLVDVRSTLSGIVVTRNVFTGEPVEPDKSLFTVVNLSAVLVRAHVYESDRSLVGRGQRARVICEAYPGRVFEGTVDFVGGEIEESSRTLPVWVTVSNPEEKLRPNMLAEVSIVVGVVTEAIAVPKKAILRSGNNRFVFIENGDALVKQSVRVGETDDRFAEVIEGLFPGDRVVVSGNESLEFATSSPIAVHAKAEAP